MVCAETQPKKSFVPPLLADGAFPASLVRAGNGRGKLELVSYNQNQ